MELQPIRLALKEKKMTYEELSKKSNIPLGTIKRIMSGITPDPRESTVYAIKKALELIPKEKNQPTPLPQDELHLLEVYRKLDTVNKMHVSAYAEIRLEEQEKSVSIFQKK